LGKFIVIGATGLMGQHMHQFLISEGCDVSGTGYRQASDEIISFDMSTQSILAVVPSLGPDCTVVLFSSFVDQTGVFESPKKSHELNVVSTKRCMKDVLSTGAQLVFPSTESVFNGEKDGYVEEDETNPLTLYAKQKVEAEDFLKSCAGNWLLVRTGWNVGWTDYSRGVIEVIYNSMLRPGALVASDNWISITDMNDTVYCIKALVDNGCQGIYHIAANPPILRSDIAAMIKAASLKGANMKYDLVPFSSFDFSEPRPRKAWLKNKKIVKELAFSFASAKEIIAKKAVQIDSWNQPDVRAGIYTGTGT
jgi:dTDP-4-dehydrorhamnose reductase